MDLTLSNLARTMKQVFRIGSINIKDSSGVVQARNAADTAYADVAANQIRVQGSNATEAIILSVAGGLGASETFVLPSADGSAGQFLSTDGSGTLSFATASPNAVLAEEKSFDQTTTTLTIFTPPANAIVEEVAIQITSAASGGSPTAKVGVSGNLTRDMDTTENDIKIAGLYKVYPKINVGGSPVAIVLTISASAQTFAGKVSILYSNPN